MPGDTPDAPDGAPLPPPLPLRLPHPFATHVAVDTAVAFLGTVILGLILGVSFLVIVAMAIVAGLCLAPFTRRTEARQLAEIAERRERRDQAEARDQVDDLQPPGDDAT